MSIFELDEQGRKQLDEQAALRPLDLSTVKPGFFEGLGSAVGSGIMRGGARAGTAALVAGAVPVIGRDQYLSSFATDDVADFLQANGVAAPARGAVTSGQDSYFENVVEDVGQRAVDAWTPDPTQTGTAGRVLGGLAEIVLPLAAGGGNPSLLAATEGLERPASLVKQGVDAKTATAVGTVGAAGTLLGFKLPAAFGTTLTQRLATGAAGNLVLGAGTSGIQYAALKSAGNDAQAAMFDPTDAEARTVDLLTGLAFGGLAHAMAPRVPLAQRDAVLTARNANKFQRAATDGLVPSESANVSGQQALQDAMDQLARGEQVNVADTIRPEDFILPAEPLRYTGVEAAGRIDQRIEELTRLSTEGRLSKEAVASLKARDQEIRTVLRREGQLERDGIVRADPSTRPDVMALAAEQVSIRAQLEAGAGTTGYASELKRLQQRLAKVDDDSQLIDLAMRLDGRTAQAPVLPVSGYSAYRRALESGGQADARNPSSSAFGIDQFTAGTWRRIVRKTQPSWAAGLDDAQLLEQRGNPQRSSEMVAALDYENAAGLQAAGLPVTVHTLYAAHHFGLTAGRKFAAADGATPMERIITPEQLAANGYLRGKTKQEAAANWDQRAKRAGVLPDGGSVDTNSAGQALRRRLVDDPEQIARDYAALDESDGGRILNTDTARELSPEYLADRTRSADVHEAASDTVKLLYEQKLAQPTPAGMDNTVLFTAGGTGAGKTTGMRAMGDAIGRPEIVYDTNMNTLSSAVDKIEKALAAGRNVDIVYVYRDPVEALTGGAIPRAQRQAEKFGTGRTVPLAEHAKTHVGVRPTMEAIAARYADDPRVQVSAVDNSRGKNKQQVVDLATLPRVEETTIHERLQAALEEARAGGLAENLYRGFGGPGQGARPALAGNRGGNQRPGQGPSGESGKAGQVSPAESSVTAARQLAAEHPDASIVVGADADGNAVHRSLSDELADIDAELLRATTDSTAYQAAVNCLLRRG